MKARFFIVFLAFFAIRAHAQVPDQDTISVDNDSITLSYMIPDVTITNVRDTMSADMKKQLIILRRRVMRVYPYAKIAAERLTLLNKNMSLLKTDKEKKKYSKIVEGYLENEFEGQLKNLSRKDGQILIKLIHRQTGESAFDLIKEYKSGWKAWWSTKIAKMFDLNLKTTYSPATVAEDFYIEGFLLEAFRDYKLVRQEPAFPINYAAIKQGWREKSK